MKVYIILSFIFMTLLSTPAFAETIYVLATPLYQDTTEVEEEPTAFAQTIDIDRFEKRYTTTQEVLRSATGANIRSIGGLGGYSTVSLRGAGAHQCLVLVDGIRLNTATGGGVDISQIPLSNVKRIDIIRGSDSALFGENALGGVVNIVTKDPRKTLCSDLDASIGSYGARAVSVGLSGPMNDRVSLVLDVSRRHADNDYTFENNNGTENDHSDDFEDTRKNNAFDDISVMAKITAQDTKWSVKATGIHYDSHKEMPGIITFPTPQAQQDITRNTYHLSTRTNYADTLDINVNVSRSQQDNDYEDPLNNTFSDTETVDDHAVFSCTYSLADITFSPGFSYLRESINDSSFGIASRDTRSGIMRMGFSREIIDILATFRMDDNSRFDREHTYRAGLMLRLLDWLRIKANIGKGYRTPSYYELYFDHGFIIGNRDLSPEESYSWDVGPSIEHEIFGISLSYFNTRYDDLITYILQSGLYFKPYNISRSKAHGIEFHAWIEPCDEIRVSGNYTFNKIVDSTGEANRDGNQIPGQPRNSANVQIDLNKKIRQQNIGFYAGYNYIEGNFVTRANTKKLPDRRIVNAGFSVDLIKNLTLSFDIKNVFDKKVYDLRGFPLEGRSFYLTGHMEI